MEQTTAVVPEFNEVILVKLAREIAMDIHPIETILEMYKVSSQTWASIQTNSRFTQLLGSEAATWGTALNTHERVKVKSAAVMEEWLPELNMRIHDPGETLNAKIEAGKLIARLAGMGLTNATVADAGERFSVTINLGSDTKLTFDKQLPPRMIDGEAEEL